MSGMAVKSSINIKSAGNPRSLVAPDSVRDGEEVLVSTIVGFAQGTNRRTNPNGAGEYVGLVGVFACVSSDPNKEQIRSNICYLPDAIQAPIQAALEKVHETDPTGMVRFACENYAVKGGTAGFTWKHRPIMDGPASIDPLESLMKALPEKGGVKQLGTSTDAEKAAAASTAQAATEAASRRPDAQGNKPAAEPKRGSARV